jgi:hypothetical protein
MKLLTSSILTLIALYVIYSEPFKLPTIVKKNKKLSYILIIGLYLYYHQNNVVEGMNMGDVKKLIIIVLKWILGIILVVCFLISLTAPAADAQIKAIQVGVFCGIVLIILFIVTD